MPVRLRKIVQTPRQSRVSPAAGIVYKEQDGTYSYFILEQRRNKQDKWTPVEVVTE
jgi:hypothetical protein